MKHTTKFRKATRMIVLSCLMLSVLFGCKEEKVKDDWKTNENFIYGKWKLETAENFSLEEQEKWKEMELTISKKDGKNSIFKTTNSYKTNFWENYAEWEIIKQEREKVELKKSQTDIILINQINENKIKISKFVQHDRETLDICCYWNFYFIKK